MPITCRIPIVADDEAELIVVITARQLAAFRTVLRTESEQTGTAPLVQTFVSSQGSITDEHCINQQTK